MASIPTQEEVLAATRKSQEAMIAAIKTWLETVRTATPKLTSVYAPLTDSKLSVSLPFADRLPTPQDAVASAYHLAEQLLASQRRFAEELLKAITPLMPGRSESAPELPSRGAWQEAVTDSEPKTPAASTAPKAVGQHRAEGSGRARRRRLRPAPRRRLGASTPPRAAAKAHGGGGKFRGEDHGDGGDRESSLGKRPTARRRDGDGQGALKITEASALGARSAPRAPRDETLAGAVPPAASHRRLAASRGSLGLRGGLLQGPQDGWAIDGTTAAVEDTQTWVVTYSIGLDDGWVTRSARITARTVSGSRETLLAADGAGRWLVNGEPASIWTAAWTWTWSPRR